MVNAAFEGETKGTVFSFLESAIDRAVIFVSGDFKCRFSGIDFTPAELEHVVSAHTPW